MNRLIILLTFLILIQTSCNQRSNTDTLTKNLDSLKTELNQCKAKNDSLVNALQDMDNNFESLEQLSSGEFRYVDSNSTVDYYGYNYRVEIYLSEIYKSMYLTKVEYYDEGSQRLSPSFKVDIMNTLHINDEQTNSLRFIGWKTPDKFEISVDSIKYNVSIIDSAKVQINEEK